jgi:hypothetical protein
MRSVQLENQFDHMPAADYRFRSGASKAKEAFKPSRFENKLMV